MRLLNVKTLDFEDFIGEVGDGIPSYAILSHTWGVEEVSYSDYVNQKSLSKKGYDKIRGCCHLAESEGFEYVWVDTCCIDKSSSAELSEAINSMFRWYRDAGICYAYLSDVDSREDPIVENSSFSRSRWFERGWTLQELLAPSELVFIGSDWSEIGTKKSLHGTVSRITRISEKVLAECRWDEYSIAQKMSWAANRRTTRLEDEAYCLIGLFDVNMPLLYGEGRKAFLRLQQEILKQSDDHSIFAWSYPEEEQGHTQLSGLIAPSPKHFQYASRIELSGYEQSDENINPFQVINQLVKVSLRLVENVKAVKSQRILEKPPLFNILEIQRDEATLPQSPDMPEEHHQEEPSVVQIDQSLPVPVITVEDLDASTSNSAKTLTKPKAQEIKSGIIVRESHQSKIDLWVSLESFDITSPATWRWYIYEPVIIVPLRCHLGDYQLAILFSRGSIETKGRALSRLHNPSLLAATPSMDFGLAPLTTVHASLSPRTLFHPNSSVNSLSPSGRLVWPEIRIASVLLAGYAVLVAEGVGWTLDRTRPALVQKRDRFLYEAAMNDYAPLLLFYRAPVSANDSRFPAFFFSIPEYKKHDLTCEIGVYIPGSALSMALDYNLYRYDLAHDRGTEVPLGNGQVIVTKYRQGAGASFICVSIESPKRDIRIDPVPHDSTKTDQLSSRLFPMLRSLR